MSGNNYSSGEIFGIVSFVVIGLGVAIGAYQLGQGIGGAGQGAQMQPAAVASTVNGQALYTNNCLACHGAKAEGGVGPALAASAAWSDDEFGAAIIEGKTPSRELALTMPRFPLLDGKPTTREQVAALHEYIKGLQ